MAHGGAGREGAGLGRFGGGFGARAAEGDVETAVAGRFDAQVGCVTVFF